MAQDREIRHQMGGGSSIASATYAPFKYQRDSQGGKQTRLAYVDEYEIRYESYDAPPRIERMVIRVEPGEAIDLEMLEQVMPLLLESVLESHAQTHGVVELGTPRTDIAAHMQAEPNPAVTRARIRKQLSRRDLNSAFIHEIADRYRRLKSDGRFVYKTLAAEYSVSEKTVESWIKIARHEYGLLEATTRKGNRNGNR